MPNIFSDNGAIGLKFDYGDATKVALAAATELAPVMLMTLADQSHKVIFHNDSDQEVQVLIANPSSLDGIWQQLLRLAAGQTLAIENYAGPMCLFPPRTKFAAYSLGTHTGKGDAEGKCRIYCWLA